MSISILIHLCRIFGESAPSAWRRLDLPYRLAAGASILVICGMVQLGIVMTGNVRENIMQRSAAAAALYIASFVEPHVQQLGTREALSENNRQALERVLSPASMHRPVIAFRIWNGNVAAFSNEREIVGKTFPPTLSRTRALQGQIAVEFDDLDDEDEAQVKSLNVPVLEVYAPLREQGTGRIIAAAETYEIANDLRREMFVSQLMTWLAIGAVTLIIVVLMFSMANSGGIERHSLIRRIAELTRLRAESEARRQRVSHANLHVSEMNERSMDRVRTALHEGPAQFVALALLKFDSLDRLICRAKNGAPPTDEQALEDLETIRKALNETLRHIRGVSTTLLPSDIEEMSVGDTLARAVRRHERRTGVEVQYVADGLLQQLPFPVKACLYRFVLEGLESMAENGGAAGQAMRASFDGEKIVLAITSPCPEVGTPRPISSSDIRALRDRVEAVGGSFSFRSSPHEGVSLLAEFTFSEVNRD